MIQLISDRTYYVRNQFITNNTAVLAEFPGPVRENARQNTITYKILKDHNSADNMENLRLKFDALASHDITYVGIIQTARASGLKAFPLPYVLTNCHNSLCAVGGTINEDDHLFGLSAARKYGGNFVPAHQAVIHQYMRETMAACGSMILGSDSHTRYGALGTLGFGEGGPVLVNQLLGKTYDLPYPKVIAVYLENSPQPGVGPQDVALALIGAVFTDGLVKNSILEFIGPGVAGLSMDFRNGIDVMTTETTCLSSIWQTDEKTAAYLKIHGRAHDYSRLIPGQVAEYDAAVSIDLAQVQPMIALPFHPSRVMTIHEANKDARVVLASIKEEALSLMDGQEIFFEPESWLDKGKIRAAQGVIAGCAGGMYENISYAAAVLRDKTIGDGGFNLSIYPSSQPVYQKLVVEGRIAELMEAGAVIRSAFCGPCFGAGDTPANNTLSLRHTTRNFPNREGSKPDQGQISAVALMDARSIAATAAAGGVLTAATDVEIARTEFNYSFNAKIYSNRVYVGWENPQQGEELVLGPNIKDWPRFTALPDNLLLNVAAYITDTVTTTDELIPSGETSSFRSNPYKLAEFTLSRKVPSYVSTAKQVCEQERLRQKGETPAAIKALLKQIGASEKTTAIGSLVAARKPGDGSAREQAASCQKVLGGWANLAVEYATKRYRSNVINWGMLPLVAAAEDFTLLAAGDWLFLENVRELLRQGAQELPALRLRGEEDVKLMLGLPLLTREERQIILAGCLMNYYQTP